MSITLPYDLHLHSCLSPCCDADMTPGNIVGMAALAGLRVAALSDHNTCQNCPPFLQHAKKAGLIALPACELTTREEVHILCLFAALDAAMAFSGYLYGRLPDILNDTEIYGAQILIGDDDRPRGLEPRLLLSAADIGVYEISKLMRSYGGLAVPAHIDRPSFSLLSNLGFYDPAMDFPVMELSQNADETVLRLAHPELNGVRFIRSSDAHTLAGICDAENFIAVEEATPEGVLTALHQLTIDE